MENRLAVMSDYGVQALQYAAYFVSVIVFDLVSSLMLIPTYFINPYGEKVSMIMLVDSLITAPPRGMTALTVQYMRL